MTAAAESALLSRRQRLLGPAYRLFYTRPLQPVRGDGAWLYDADGEAYLDFYNNVPCVGHGNPHVVEALERQARRLNTHTRYLSAEALDYVERLLATFPPELGNAMLTCSGSEANDLAYRIARARTAGTGFIVTEFAYHGVTAAIAELSPSLGPGLAPTARTVRAPDARAAGTAGVADAFAADVRAAIADLEAHGVRPAALICDTIFSSDGVFAEPAGFLAPAVAEIRAAGGVFIADEVQAGFGRTGAGMWGFARHGVTPDVVTMGKPMGNGHPMAGLVARPEVLEPFATATRYFNTFGGNTVSCAVGMAVLDVIEREGLVANAREVGGHLMAGLRELADRHDVIGDVRGAGLFVGVEIVEDGGTRSPATAVTAEIVDGLRERRILVGSTGRHANVLKLRPPLVASRDHADRLVGELDEVLERIRG